MITAEEALKQTNSVNIKHMSEVKLDKIKYLIDVAISEGMYSVVCHHSDIDSDITQLLENLGYKVTLNRIYWLPKK